MTELEYEKACRGSQAPVSGEFAWGNTIITPVDSYSSAGTIAETFANAGANAVTNLIPTALAPIRVGAFASATTSRTQAGANYYGIMEMSGNLQERVVTIGNATGRAFTGLHGNGTLSNAGHTTTTDWPGLTSGEVTGETGSGSRGGEWGEATNQPGRNRVSDRWFSSSTNSNRGSNDGYGFRGVRSAL